MLNPPLQDGYCLTVMSHDPRESACKRCGQVRVIYQAHYFAFTGESVRARCKSCHTQAAEERGGNIFVKSVGGKLPSVWAKDRRLQGDNAGLKAIKDRRSKASLARR